MSSMSEPREITGLPDPHVATHAVGTPANPRVTLKPFFSRMPVRYFDVSSSCMPSSPKLKTMSTICCEKVDMLSTMRIASFFSAASLASSGGRLTGNVTSGRVSGPCWPPRPCAASGDETTTRLAASATTLEHGQGMSGSFEEAWKETKCRVRRRLCRECAWWPCGIRDATLTPMRRPSLLVVTMLVLAACKKDPGPTEVPGAAKCDAKVAAVPSTAPGRLLVGYTPYGPN